MPISEYPDKSDRRFISNAVVRVSGPMAVLELAMTAKKLGEPLDDGESIPEDLGDIAMPPEALGDDEIFDEDYDDESLDDGDEDELFRLISSLGNRASVKEAEYYVSEASLTERDGSLVLSYPELEAASALTEVSFDIEAPNVITIVHTGGTPYIFVIEEDVRHVCVASGGNAPELVIVGKRVKNDLTREGGELKLEFSIESPLIPRASASINYTVKLTETE